MYKYLITSKEFYRDEITLFCDILATQIEKHQPTHILYRDKDNGNYAEQASHFVRISRSYKNLKIFIHQDIELAKKLGADGVHLSSTQFCDIAKAKDLGLIVIISTHTREEIFMAKDLGADAVTYSPIFVSPNKGNPKGLEDLKEAIRESDIDIFALGGIVTEEHIRSLEKIGVYGFASIRYFY